MDVDCPPSHTHTPPSSHTLLQTLEQRFEPKYKMWTDSEKKSHKVQNFQVENFTLQLVSLVVYGENTLLLGFSLDLYTRGSNTDVLVVRECT